MKESEFSSTDFNRITELQREGWDLAAIVVYIHKIKENKLKWGQGLFLIGSEMYTEMFAQSELSAQEKVILVINHLGGYLNEVGDLQFEETKYRFYEQMPPGALFFSLYAKAVQQAYPNGLLIAKEDKKLSKIVLKKKYSTETKIHQFRNQLDKCTIEYVENYREKYDLQNDETAIKMILGKNWFYADPHYHNRAQLGVVLLTDDIRKNNRTMTNKGLFKKLKKEGFYRKIVSADYHSEFIVDEAGQLLSQWSEAVKRTDHFDCAIANGETFNYGERPRIDSFQTHDKLDGNPPRFLDTEKRNTIKKSWISPKDNWVYQLVRRLAEKGVRYKSRSEQKHQKKNNKS